MCEYYAHEDCKDFAVNDCRETATYVPARDNVSEIKMNSLRRKDLQSFSQPHPFDINIIGVKEIYQRIPNVPSVGKPVGPVNVLLECDVNGVE